MRGRFREICAGINCDLGTAAAFREQWKREIQPSTYEGEPTALLLKTNQAPGDAVVMTAAIYSLHRAHPGKYLTAVESPYPEVFAHNPDIVANNDNDASDTFDEVSYLPVHMHYPAIHDSNQRGIHFMQGWCEHLSYSLGIDVPLLTNRPHLYFPNPKMLDGDYWIVCSGGKNDLTNKLWGHNRYQEVVVKTDLNWVQVGLNPDDHPRLRGTKDMVGKTTLRDLFWWVRDARGVLCGVSLLMHIAAALEKPCVVIAGGREPVQWNAYPKQHYLHTIGEMDCVSIKGENGACWRSRTVPLGTHDILDTNTCLHPVGNTPECMTRIRPEWVAELIRRINNVPATNG